MTPEQIEVFRNCGGAEMPLEESCMIAECTLDEFAESEEAQKAYRTEQLKTKLKIRQAVIKLAKEGVPKCIQIYHEVYASEVLPIIEDEEEGDESDKQEG
ncbi:MAG: hypothetical protein IKP00_07095 [Victivallales bacterium]|nr:hypothetical protein [Victivallales bacterium]